MSHLLSTAVENIGLFVVENSVMRICFQGQATQKLKLAAESYLALPRAGEYAIKCSYVN